MWQKYILPTNIKTIIELLAEYRDQAKIIAGATDVMLELEKGVHKNVHTIIDISTATGLDNISIDENGFIHLGPLVTHNQCCSSKIIQEFAYPLARASWMVGSPQIRNRGTIVGNLVTASPANDTIPSLFSLDASLITQSKNNERRIALRDFYTGVRKTILQPDEIVTEIIFPSLQSGQCGNYSKLALRKAQAISLASAAVVITFQNNYIQDVKIALGSVAPTVVRATEAERYLIGRKFSEQNIETASALVAETIHPITDLRSTEEYRRKISKIVVKRCFMELLNKQEKTEFPSHPINLSTKKQPLVIDSSKTVVHDSNSTIDTTINSTRIGLKNSLNKSLLHAIRDEIGLTGTKEGCGEGECGACTITMDGMAVMSCLIPAPRAQGAEILTIEGISQGDELNPVQSAFIEKDAVQCGYCTPGFIMSATKLLEEKSNPTRDEIRQAITGNLCRCTGYYKIIQAIELAANSKKN